MTSTRDFIQERNPLAVFCPTREQLQQLLSVICQHLCLVLIQFYGTAFCRCRICTVYNHAGFDRLIFLFQCLCQYIHTGCTGFIIHDHFCPVLFSIVTILNSNLHLSGFNVLRNRHRKLCLVCLPTIKGNTGNIEQLVFAVAFLAPVINLLCSKKRILFI